MESVVKRIVSPQTPEFKFKYFVSIFELNSSAKATQNSFAMLKSLLATSGPVSKDYDSKSADVGSISSAMADMKVKQASSGTLAAIDASSIKPTEDSTTAPVNSIKEYAGTSTEPTETAFESKSEFRITDAHNDIITKLIFNVIN